MTGELIITIVALMVLVIAGAVAAMLYRRRVLEDESSPTEMGVLAELRRLRDAGELSEEEFEVARKRAASRLMGRPAETPRLPRSGEEALVARPGLDLAGDPLPPSAFEQDPSPPEEGPEEGEDRHDRP